MAITAKTASDIVYGADHALHAVVKGAMLRQARIIRDTVDGTASEFHQRWARQVLGGNDGSYPAILRRGDRVVITGFGVFEAKKVAAREGRNPKTGESIQIPAHRRVAFLAGKGLKSRVAD